MSKIDLSNVTVDPSIPEMNFLHTDAEITLNASIEKVVKLITAKSYKSFSGVEKLDNGSEKVSFGRESWNGLDVIAILINNGILTDFSYSQCGNCWHYMLYFLGHDGYTLSHIVPPIKRFVASIKDTDEFPGPVPTCEYYFHKFRGTGITCVISIPEVFDCDNYSYVVKFSNRILIPKNGVAIN